MKREEQLSILFMKIGSEYKKTFSTIDAKIDCSNKDMRILEFLFTGPKTMKELASHAQLTPGTMTVAIEKLVQEKYVKRSYDKDDRRKITIELLAKGKKVAEQINKSSNLLAKKMLSSLSTQDQKEMIRILSDSVQVFD